MKICLLICLFLLPTGNLQGLSGYWYQAAPTNLLCDRVRSVFILFIASGVLNKTITIPKKCICAIFSRWLPCSRNIGLLTGALITLGEASQQSLGHCKGYDPHDRLSDRLQMLETRLTRSAHMIKCILWTYVSRLHSKNEGENQLHWPAFVTEDLANFRLQSLPLNILLLFSFLHPSRTPYRRGISDPQRPAVVHVREPEKT